MSDFHASLLDMDKETIISKSAEITAMREARAFMQSDFTFEPGDIAELFNMNDLFSEVIEAVKQSQGLHRQALVTPEETKGSVLSGKPSAPPRGTVWGYPCVARPVDRGRRYFCFQQTRAGQRVYCENICKTRKTGKNGKK